MTNAKQQMDALDLFVADVSAKLREPSVAEQRRTQLATLRRTAANSIDNDERARLQAEALSLELGVEWDAIAVVFMVEVEQCTNPRCNHESFSSAGLYALELSRSRPLTKRLVRWQPQSIDARLAVLPKQHAFRVTRVGLCPMCAFAEGYTEQCDFPV